MKNMKRDTVTVARFLITQCILLCAVGLAANVKNTVQVTKPAVRQASTTTTRSALKDMPPFPHNASDWCRIFRYTDALIYRIISQNLTAFSNEIFEAIRGHHKLVTGIFVLKVTKGYEQLGDAYFNATMQAGGLTFLRLPVEKVTKFFRYNKTLQQEATKKHTKSIFMWQELMKTFNQRPTPVTVPRFL